jgi:hypothetical protein
MDEYAACMPDAMNPRGFNKRVVLPCGLSMVGEFMSATIPKYCQTLAKNTYHNGHPDLVPKGKFPKDACQHGTEGVEIKGSRHTSGWKGHNAEDAWLMVFVFNANSARDASQDNRS